MMDQLEKFFYTTNTISNPSQIASDLVPIVQNCTTTKFPQTLVDYVGEVSEKRPQDIDTICKALSILLSDPQLWEMPLIGEDPVTFGLAFSRGFSEKINDGLWDVFADDHIGNLSIDSTNVCLTSALLSASAMKHNPQHVDRHIPQAVVLLGLQDPNPGLMPKPEKNEIYGVVAIIHLAILGDKMAARVERRLSIDGGVKNALKSLKQKRILKSPSSVKLLDHVIANEESGYKKNISENDVWDMLFPQSFLHFLGRRVAHGSTLLSLSKEELRSVTRNGNKPHNKLLGHGGLMVLPPPFHKLARQQSKEFWLGICRCMGFT